MKADPFELSPLTTDDARVGDESAPASAPAAYVGPFDREPWPDRLIAHVVSPDPDPRIHGYPVAGDLARFGGIADVAWLTLRGELPTAAQRAALEVAIVLLAPVHIGQAPAHAALLSRIGGALPSATVAIAAVGLGELSRHELTELAPWRAWLGHRSGAVPASARAVAASADAVAAQAWLDGRMREWFGADRGLPATALTRVACAHALLYHLGLHEPLVVDALGVWARLLVVVAEAGFARAGEVRRYPARLPDFQYVDDRGAQP